MVGTETAEPSTPNVESSVPNGGVKFRCPCLGIQNLDSMCLGIRNLANHRSSAYRCAHFRGEITNNTIAVGNQRLLHLHCFQHYHQVTGCDLFPDRKSVV